MTTTAKKHPISANHPDYARTVAKIKRCRDACKGSDAIKDAGPEYLPSLSSHRSSPHGASKYEAYKQRALWYNASRRTKIGLSGAVTRSAPNIKTSAKYEGIAKAIAKHYRTTIEELLEAGRLAFSCNLNGMKADTRLWWAESIVNWGYTVTDGQTQLRFVVLEDVEDSFDPTDAETSIAVSQQTVRHLYVLINGVCHYAKYGMVENKEEQWVTLVSPKPVTALGGRELNFIPVKITQALDDDDPETQDPVMLDLVDVNISHYHNSADLEHGRHWTALPTAWASGFPTKDDSGADLDFAIGGESAWITEQPGAQAGYLEFSGAGLSHLADGMKEKQSMMAVLGARLIEEMKPAVESAETLKTRLAGDSSVLSRICATASKTLTWVLQCSIFLTTLAYEMGNETEDQIAVSDDIFNEKMSDAELTALVAALQVNAISYQVFFDRLKQGKVIPAARTIEEEREAIDAGRPGNNDPFANSGGGGFGGGGRW